MGDIVDRVIELNKNMKEVLDVLKINAKILKKIGLGMEISSARIDTLFDRIKMLEDKIDERS